ncbi:Fusaric acid resistance protein-like-domain-containing protein [Sporodiniella umbellata]|nr:Fusaric acid resistance protein-like-domain-containing protein [Sporodiniella umbellata]
MFTIGTHSDSGTEEEEESTTEVNDSNQQFPTKTRVQFPDELEQRYCPTYPKPPIEDEEEEEEDKKVSRKDRWIQYIETKIPSRIFRRVLKCTIAYFLSSLFSLILPAAHAIGPVPFFAVTAMLFSHPGRTMGAQFDATITAVLGVVAAILYAFAGIAASVAYNVAHPTTYITQPIGRVINVMFLFVGIFGAQMLRQVYPKFHFFSLQFMIVQIFSMSRSINYLQVPFGLPLNYGIPLLVGHSISLLVNLVFWPETAVDGLGRALKETITSSKDMLHMITKQFFLDPKSELVPESTVDGISAKMRMGMTKVKTAYREAKYEISYSYIRPQQLSQVRKSLDRLTRHLTILGSCLKTERELFESAIEALQAEMHDDDSDLDGEHDETFSSRRSYSEEDMNLLRTSLRATDDYINGKYTSGASTPRGTSRPTSRMSSHANSRASSTHASEDEDYVEQNQKSVNSLKSFLSLPKLSAPKPKIPQKTRKQTEYQQRHLLMTYLEGLRDPLMELSLDCTSVLECVCDGIASELSMDSFLKYIANFSKESSVQAEQRANERHGGCTKCNCSQNIRLAIIQFDRSERQRMHALYDLNKIRPDHGGTLDLGMRQELFLVFFFIFTMREIANELQEMTLQMDELRLHSRKTSFKGKKRKHLYMPVLSIKMWRKWASGNNHQSTKDKGGYTLATLNELMPKEEPKKPIQEEEYKLAKIQTNNSIMRTRSRGNSLAASTDIDGSPLMIRRRRQSSFHRPSNASNESPRDIRIPVPENAFNEKDMKEEEEKLEKIPLVLRVRHGIWETLQFFSKYEFKFALKMAVAVTVLCIPAYVPSSVEWYYNTRGQWAPMTVIAIMNPTSGGTLVASFWRIVGTVVGAMVGWGALQAGGGSPYLLGIFAVLLAIPSFYIHLGSTYNKVGIVCLTTYEVVALSRYVTPPPNETVAETVWKRTLTLVVGVCVALMLNSMVWPFVARHMVRKSIGACLVQLEDYYTFVMGAYLYHDPRSIPSDEDITKGEKMESKIIKAIEGCSVLLELTDNEPRIRGPFPKAFYKEMIVCLRNLLDRMLTTRIALIKMPLVVKHDVCSKHYHDERIAMISAILLNFHTLASSLKCKSPLPVYMPNPRAARAKLMEHRRKSKVQWVKFRNLTWFAMASSTQEMIDELEYLGHLIRFTVGDSPYSDNAKRIEEFMNYSEDSFKECWHP